MTDLLRLLAQNAPLLLAGSTVLLSLGCGAVLLVRSPVHRQRISELTIIGVLGWSLLALVPLPRLLPEHAWEAKSPAPTTSPATMGTQAEEIADENSLVVSAPLAETPQIGPVLIPELQVPQVHVFEEAITEIPTDSDVLATTSLLPSPSEEITRQATPSPLLASTPASPIWQLDLTKLLGLVTGAYLAGASLCLLWILAGYLLLFRIRREASHPPDWLIRHFRLLARQSGIAPPRLIVSQLCTRPITWGVFWPVVVLPQALCRPENKSQLTTILLHELGHIAQQDAQGNLLFCAALPLLYAHPLYWWLRRESQLAAELVADDWAAWQTGKEMYVEELVALAKCTGKSSLPLVGVTGLFSSPSQFYRRMHMLLAREKPLSTRTSLPWRLASLSALAGAVALAASLAGVRPVIGQAPPATPPAIEPTTPPSVDPTTPPALTPPVLPDPVPAPGTTPPPAVAAPTAPKLPLTTDPVLAPPVGAPFAVPPGTVPLSVGAAPPVEANAVPAPPAGVGPPNPALDPEEAALLKEIEQLREKLRALELKRGPNAWQPAGIKAVNIKPGMKTVELHRVDDHGVHWSEVWSTDDKGQPTKLISKSAYSHKQPNTFGSDGRIAASPDGKTFVRETVEKDGIRVTTIVDAATGKVIGENRTGGARYTKRKDTSDVVPDSKPDEPTVERRSSVEFPMPTLKSDAARAVPVPGKYPPPATAAYPVLDSYDRVAAQPKGVPAIAKGDQQLDLVSLATSYADAVSILEAAEVKMAEISKLGDAKAISQHEVVSAKLALSAAKRKEQLLRSIAQVATDSAAQEFERTAQLQKSGEGNASASAEARARLEILKQILNARPAENPAAKP